jgi:hypothetical protein
MEKPQTSNNILKVIRNPSIHFLAKVKWLGCYLYVSEQAPSASLSSTSEVSIIMLLLGHLVRAGYATEEATNMRECHRP